jgi:hypothetical protein
MNKAMKKSVCIKTLNNKEGKVFTYSRNFTHLAGKSLQPLCYNDNKVAANEKVYNNNSRYPATLYKKRSGTRKAY